MSEITISRDSRIDTIGLIGQLGDYADKLRDGVKARLLENKIERAAADAFEGLIVRSSTTSVYVDRVLDLYDQKKITREQLESCVSIRKDPLGKFLSGDQIAALSTRPKPATPKLRIDAIETVQVSLVEAVRRVARDIAP